MKDPLPSNELETEELEKEQTAQQKKKQKPKKKQKISFKWPLVVLVLTFTLSFAFGFGSQFILSGAGIVLSVVLLVFFLLLAMITDMIGVAATSVEIEPFNAMSAKKVKGAKECISLIKNADKVSSIFNDIIGDICGILSGTIGATLSVQIVNGQFSGIKEVLIASLVSAGIAALTVFLKAVGKKIAISKAHSIIFAFGKFISFFKFGK